MAKRMIKYFALPIILLAVGCASMSTVNNHYLIESPALKTIINSDQQIVLYPIQLSDYLKSKNLHVKSNSGEIIYSATDSWAGQPDKMLWRVIEQSLEAQTGHHVLTSYEALESCAQIKIRINELSPTTTGHVISRGRWFISVEGKTLQTNKFSFSGNIYVDGYSASNKVFANHLNQLSAELKEQISRLGLCQK